MFAHAIQIIFQISQIHTIFETEMQQAETSIHKY